MKEAEEVLKEYRKLRFALSALEKKQQQLIRKAGPSEKVTSSLDLAGVHSSNLMKSAEQIAFELLMVRKAIEETKDELSLVDLVLQEISKEEGCEWYGPLLRDWFIDKVKLKIIIGKYKYGERNIYYMRNKALKAFAIAYYGIPAFKAL